MLAAVYESAGPSDVLEVREVQTPEPGPGEVRVRVAFSGVNPTDWKRLRTQGPGDGVPFAVPHQDGSGVIDAVGPGVDQRRVGQRVWLLLAAHENRWGTAAQYSVLPAQRAVPLPESASLELGASLGVPAVTASYCLSCDGPIADSRVLVSGGAGAVGHAAISLAKFGGAAQVLTTVSNPQKAEIARGAGADVVINYRDEGAVDQIRSAAPEGIDRVIEVALDANLDLDLKVVAPFATIISYAGSESSVASVPVRQLMAPNLTLKFMLLYNVAPEQLQAAIGRTNTALDAGALSTPPLHRFPLEQVAEAHAAVEGGAVGKVLVEIP